MQDATNLADITASSTRDKLKTLEGQLIKTLSILFSQAKN